MHRLTGQANLCRARGELCRTLARHRHCEEYKRVGYEALAQHWFALEQSYRQAEEVSGFLEWASRRLEPPSAFEGSGSCKTSDLSSSSSLSSLR